eukprot:14490626-Alexandrium_andersonii.AAC.1
MRSGLRATAKHMPFAALDGSPAECERGAQCACQSNAAVALNSSPCHIQASAQVRYHSREANRPSTLPLKPQPTMDAVARSKSVDMLVGCGPDAGISTAMINASRQEIRKLMVLGRCPRTR